MTLSLLGTTTLGVAVPVALAAQLELDTSINLALPEVQAKLDGALAAQAQLTITPPSLVTSLVAAMELVAALEAAIALDLPNASLDLSILANVIAELGATLGALSASAAFSGSLSALLATPGVTAYAFTGKEQELGPDAAALLNDAVRQNVGVLLLAHDGGAITALRAMFGLPS